MKMLLRVGVGLIGLVAVFFGVRQMMTGVCEMSGSSPAAPPQKIGETFTSTEKGDSHRIPQGWESKPAPPSTTGMIVAPPASGLASNIVMAVEALNGTLRAYVDANIESIKKSAPDAQVASDAEFVTAAKTVGYKLKLRNKMNDVALAHFMYFFEGPSGKKIIVTCSAPASQAAQFESLFDECMKTFALSHS